MSAPKPGDFITAKCSRCDDTTGHVVMLVLDGQIAKVECKACGSIHKYRDAAKRAVSVKREASVRHVKAGQTREEGRTVSTESRTVAKSPASTGRAAPVRKSAAAKLESAWQEAMLRHSGEEAAPYSMNASFTTGTLMEHPVFGLGEVTAVARPDKVTVLFQEGIKVLRCKLA